MINDERKLNENLEELIKEEEESYGMMSRIIGVFIEPDKAFMHIGRKPEIWGALLAVFVVLLIAGLFTMNQMATLTVDSIISKMSDQGVPTEQIEMTANITTWVMRFQFLLNTITMAIVWVIIGLVAYIVGLFLGQDANYKSTLAVIAYSSLPSILIKQGVIATIVFMSHSWTTIEAYQKAMINTVNLYALIGNPEMNGYLQGLLVSLDPFLIWSMFLMALGFRWANNVKPEHGWRTAIIVTVITLAASVLMTGGQIAALNAS